MGSVGPSLRGKGHSLRELGVTGFIYYGSEGGYENECMRPT